MVSLRRPPKMMALIGTPCGSFASGASTGLFVIGVVNRLLGWAAFSFEPGVHLSPFQSRHSLGGGPSLPSHHTSRSWVSATLVKSVSCEIISIALELDRELVPGTTPKYPASGLMAQSRPSGPGFIQAMSSPIVRIFQPLKWAGGIIMAKLVLPHALGNAAATYVFSPVGDSIPRMSMCSANQFSCRP